MDADRNHKVKHSLMLKLYEKINQYVLKKDIF